MRVIQAHILAEVVWAFPSWVQITLLATIPDKMCLYIRRSTCFWRLATLPVDFQSSGLTNESCRELAIGCGSKPGWTKAQTSKLRRVCSETKCIARAHRYFLLGKFSDISRTGADSWAAESCMRLQIDHRQPLSSLSLRPC